MKLVRQIVISFSVGLLVTSQVYGDSFEKERDRFTKRFDKLIVPQVESVVTKPGDNLQGTFAWNTSYYLSGLVEMLDATRDPKYAVLFIKLGRWVVNGRDDRHDRRDVYRERVVRAWGSTKYTKGKHYTYAVHTGRYAPGVLQWGRLARYSESVRDRMLKFYRAGKFDKRPSATLGIAYLVSAMGSGQVAPFKAETELKYKHRLVDVLVKSVPDLLATYDARTGRFGKGIWICTDQNRMYPLAVAYAYASPNNPYHKDGKLLDIIMKAGDALIDDADERGQWVFRKKDGSTWGSIWMPWTYSRWVRSYLLIRDDMPADRREAWIKALTLAYTGISRTQLKHVHNIPAHHAMGLYLAGKALDRSAWCKQASAFLGKVIDSQSDGGYWSENVGPVVGYNFVYLDALGTYYAISGDERALDALKKGARFHYHFR